MLLTVEFYWPHLGGAEEVCRRIAEGLARRGHEVHVATSKDGQEPGREELNGVRIHEFAVRGNEVKGLRGEVDRYRRFVASFECDVLFNYAAQSWTTDVAMQELGRLRAQRTVLAPCGYSGLSNVVRRAVYAGYFRRLPARLHRYDLIIYHSRTFRDARFGDAHGVKHVQVIGNGVDRNEFARPRGGFRRTLGIGDGPLLVNVSNHYRLKGHERYLQLASELPCDTAIVLLGRDPAPAWQSCARACALRAARAGVRLFDGDRDAVVQAMRDADLFVLTSRSEVAPLVLLEAAAAGTPWVSFDVGNARELKGGVVVRHRQELTSVVSDLLFQPGERRRLAVEGRAFAADHDWERKVDEYERALQSLLVAAAKRA